MNLHFSEVHSFYFKDVATEMSYNFNQLILRKRLLGALLQRNTTEQIFFHLILLFFPTQFYTAEQTTESFISFSFPTLVL